MVLISGPITIYNVHPYQTTKLLNTPRNQQSRKTQEQTFFSPVESEFWRNAGPSAFQSQKNMLKSDKI